MSRIERLEKIINSQTENLDYRYDVKAYKEYLKEWLKHKDEPEYLENGVLSFFEFWEHDIDYEFEDYNKILKLIDEYNKKKELVTNGGPGSGNFNPGQGRGVGKPGSKTGKFVKSSFPSLKMSENSKKFYEKLNPKIQESFEKCIDRLKKTNISLDNVELEFVNSNISGGDNGWVNVVDGDNINSRMIVNLIKPVLKKFTKKEQDVFKHAFVADNSSEAIIDHEFGHVLMYKKAAEIGIKPKSAHLFAEMIVKNEAKKLNIDLNDESTENFSEYAHRNYTEFIAEAYSRPDYSKLTQNVSDSLCNNKYSKDDFKNFIIEMTGIQTNENNSNITRLNAILNGGPGSGNHNPGQGRGVGKPANGHASHSKTQYSADNYLTKSEYENIVNYTSEDNFTSEELDSIAGYAISMGYGASCELNQAIKEDYSGEIIEKEDIPYPEDDSQIVTWKENREFIEQKIKDKKKIDSLEDEIVSANSAIGKGEVSDEKEIEKLKTHISELKKEKDNLSKTLRYYEFENYIKNYEKGLYNNIKDDQKMWTIDENKISKISIVKLREKQKSEPKKFDEVVGTPRLAYAMYDGDEPVSADTLLKKYQRDFKNLDKLDNIIKDKGFILDKDITVTRRVANAKVIESKIENKGEYTQNGITSVTAAKSIAKKMPSGVNMGDDLLRITIPAGTRVISTYNAFARDTQKFADEYNNGKLTEDDNMNLQMIKSQNELILPSGSKFISPNGNNISKNEDGSYQLILKVEKDKTSKNSLKIADYLRNNLSAKSYFRSQRLCSILNKVNRGNPYHDSEGKFTFSPSGVDKPSKKISYEEKFKNYENDNSHPHFDLDNIVYEYKDALDITPDEYNGEWNEETKSFEKLKNLKEYYNKVKGIQVKIVSMNPADYSHTIIDNDGEHYTSMSDVIDRTSKKGIDMYKEKFNNGERVEIPYIKFNENGKFSGEQEGFHRTLAANEIGDSEIPVAIVTKYYGKQPKLNYGRDITKKVEEYFANKKENNSRINRLVNLENRINNRKNSENVKLNKTSGNPYHDEKGRFTSSHGQGSGIGKSGKENNATKIYEKYKDRKNPKPKSLSDEERELRIRTIINNAEIMGINLEDIKEDDAYKIMKFIGWEGNEIGTVSTEFGLERISDKEIKDDDYISFNGTDSKEGFDSLRDGGYRSKIIDEDDGPGIYTSEYYDTALDYSKGEGDVAHEERVTAIKINNSNIISRDDVNKKLRNSNRNFLRNLPDSAVAALAGYDAMWTGNDDKEIVILKPSSAEIIELNEE